MSNLDAFLQLSRPPPRAVCTSKEIHDRNSVFVATLFRASNEADALRAMKYLRDVTHASKPASHEMFAWRCMVLKDGKTGLAGPDDFELRSGNEDDGEKYGGGRILKVMQAEGCIDAVVIVSRWCALHSIPHAVRAWLILTSMCSAGTAASCSALCALSTSSRARARSATPSG